MITLVREMYPNAQISEANHLKSALKQLDQMTFQLVILDLNVPAGDSIEMIYSIRSKGQHIPILILSGYDESVYAPRYLKAGANGYLHIEADPEEIRKAIQTVIHGGTYTSAAIQHQLLRSLADKRNNGYTGNFYDLSDRETEIMHLLAKGISPTDIKRQLNIQLSTISTHKARIFEKLQVSNIVQLAEKLRESERKE